MSSIHRSSSESITGICLAAIMTALALIYALLALFNGLDAFGPAGLSRSTMSVVMSIALFLGGGTAVAKLFGFGGATRTTDGTGRFLAWVTVLAVVIAFAALAGTGPNPATY